MSLPGTASVIIALTDGELQEHQLITAQQEVQHDNFILRLNPQTTAVKAQVNGRKMTHLFPLSNNRQREPGLWAP